MTEIRRAQERGHAQHGWLDSFHSFSFADYYDPGHMGFGALRVINEDRVEPGRGFGSHSHRDMEIISYVLEGGLEHRDSMGNGSVIVPGDVQRMSAGTGVAHSEFNASRSEIVHFLQIWIVPERRGLPPGYEQRRFTDDEKKNRLCLVASRDGRDGSVTLHQDAELWVALLEPGVRIAHALAPGRHAWLQVTRGKLLANGVALAEGDGAAVSGEACIEVQASEAAEVLLFVLA